MYGKTYKGNKGVNNSSAGGSYKKPPVRVKTVVDSKDGGVLGSIDYIALMCVTLLVLIGVIMVFSSSYYTSVKDGNSMYAYLKKSIVFASVGFVGLFIVSRIRYDFWRTDRIVKIMYVAINILLILTPIIGESHGGAKRWIFGFQPSEFAKGIMIITLAKIISDDRHIFDTWQGVLRYVIIMGIPVGLVAVENLSTAIVMGVIGLSLMFITEARLKWTLLFAGVGSVGVALMTFFVGFRSSRVAAWRDPFSVSDDTGYQIIQSLYAIASGGMFGLGLGGSRQKLGYMPEAHNDIIFAIICEELGWFGAFIVVLLFIFLLWRLCIIALRHKDDMFAMLFTFGVMVMIGTQVVINIAVVTNTMPNTGIPLPFISYGGTSMLMLLACMGVVMNISKVTSISKLQGKKKN
jgi:cell division protein FtsW